MSGKRWIVTSVINNNVVSARNERNQERILIGKGIGFRMKSGDEVAPSKIEKEFFLKSKNAAGKLYALIAQTPEIYMEITSEIVKMAEKELDKELDEAVFLHLMDHISFAVSRMKQGIAFKCVLLWEIRSFYPKEFAAAKKGLELINEKTGVDLPEDEAGAMAIHIINAEFDYENVNDSVRMTELIHKIINIVRYRYHMNFDEESVHSVRFTTHLKFFAKRIFQDNMLDSDDSEFHEMIRKEYAEAYMCAEKIARVISEDYQLTVTEEEKIYLAVYIRRITMAEGKE